MMGENMTRLPQLKVASAGTRAEPKTVNAERGSAKDGDFDMLLAELGPDEQRVEEVTAPSEKASTASSDLPPPVAQDMRPIIIGPQPWSVLATASIQPPPAAAAVGSGSTPVDLPQPPKVLLAPLPFPDLAPPPLTLDPSPSEIPSGAMASEKHPTIARDARLPLPLPAPDIVEAGCPPQPDVVTPAIAPLHRTSAEEPSKLPTRLPETLSNAPDLPALPLAGHLPKPAVAPARQVLDFLHTTAPVVARTIVETPLSQQASGMKVLRLRLKPEDLGEVEITLRRTGTDLHVHLAVTRQGAAEALQHDIRLLEDRIGHLLGPGTNPTITILVQAVDGATTAPETGARIDPGPQTTLGEWSMAPNGGGERPGRDREQLPPRIRGHKRHEETALPRTAVSGLVV